MATINRPSELALLYLPNGIVVDPQIVLPHPNVDHLDRLNHTYGWRGNKWCHLDILNHKVIVLPHPDEILKDVRFVIRLENKSDYKVFRRRLGKINQILPFMLMTSISPASPATISPSTVSMSPPLALISPKTLIGFGTALKTIGFIFLKMRYFKYLRL